MKENKISTYEELLTKSLTESLSDTEWKTILDTVVEKVRTGKLLNNQEVHILMEEFSYETVRNDNITHGWFRAQLIIQLDENEFYSISGDFNDDWGWGEFCSEIAVPVEKRPVIKYEWQRTKYKEVKNENKN